MAIGVNKMKFRNNYSMEWGHNVSKNRTGSSLWDGLKWKLGSFHWVGGCNYWGLSQYIIGDLKYLKLIRNGDFTS